MLDFAASAAEEGGGSAAQSRLLYMLQAAHRMLRPGGLLCIISARGWPNAAPLPGVSTDNGCSASGLPGVDACWWRWPKVAELLESHFTEAVEDDQGGNDHELDETDAEEQAEPVTEEEVNSAGRRVPQVASLIEKAKQSPGEADSVRKKAASTGRVPTPLGSRGQRRHVPSRTPDVPSDVVTHVPVRRHGRRRAQPLMQPASKRRHLLLLQAQEVKRRLVVPVSSLCRQA